MSSGGLTSGVVMSGGAGIGLQGSCPDHYSEFQGNCYSRAYGSMMSYAQAKAKCAEDGASLAVVQSQPENDYLTQMLYQKPGWLGLNNKGLNAFQWEEWTNWGLGEPSSSNGFVTKLPASGAATGDAFNDQNNGVRVCRCVYLCLSVCMCVYVNTYVYIFYCSFRFLPSLLPSFLLRFYFFTYTHTYINSHTHTYINTHTKKNRTSAN